MVHPQKLLINKSGSAEPTARNTHCLYCSREYYRKQQQQHMREWREFNFYKRDKKLRGDSWIM